MNGDFGRGGGSCMMLSSIKKIWRFFKKTEMCKKNIYRLCNIRRLEQNIKSRCNPHFFQNAWRLKCSTVRMICMCEQCDSAFCALQLTALIKPNWCFLLYCCASLYPNTILMEAGWTTAPCPAINLSISICTLSARTKHDKCCSQNSSTNKIGNRYT